MIELLLGLLIIVLVFVLAAIPLYLAVKLVGGKTKLWKVVFINIIAGFILWVINLVFPFFGGLIGLVAMLFLYMYFFRIGFLKAIVVWLVQMFIVFLFWILAVILGLSLVTAMFVL